ncbi:MAG: membrane or secreted protein [Pirellulaceae bacterium]
MRICCRLTIAVLVAAGLFGCRSDGRVFPPAGSVQKQRSNATMFDPYTDNDIGPEVVGGRPKDYQKPLSETDRSRMFQKVWSPL